ncbi:MAG: hypothetical protein OXI54_06790 [Chloroflexota bacterium]|nr:hypothetical protein [Chloroflexota bacterium]MDE2683840.1 hypothetical protein [Chloroflexota bacterium]
MTLDQHREWVQICSELAEREFTARRTVTGAEMAWGAVSHAVKWVAHQRDGMPTYSHHHVGLAVDQLDAEFSELYLASDFGQAESLHEHFYRGHLRDHQVRNSWNLAQRFIANLLSLPIPP